MMVQQIISGGQTGADRGALEGAEVAGLKTGGYAPKGWRTEAGPDSDLALFGLVETNSEGYPTRTKLNIAVSHATVAFAVYTETPGEILTRNEAFRLGRPFVCINPFNDDATERFLTWLKEADPIILNVAGNAESKASGIQEKVKSIIAATFVEPPKPKRARRKKAA